MDWKWPFVLGLAVGASAAAALLWPSIEAERSAVSSTSSGTSAPRGGLALDPPARLDWIAFGGASEPASNQVSIEQDLSLAAEVFGHHGPGVALLGGGAGVDGVQLLADAERGDALLTEIGSILDPRAGRDATYRPSRIEGSGPATRAQLVSHLEAALREPGERPLLVYLAGHGEPGDEPWGSAVASWGGHGLGVQELATILDVVGSPRPTRVVTTTCFGGGFAELVYASGDEEAGFASTPRCGLFATSWDREASGCDPNPDRGAQEGYALHFLHALMGQSRDGAPLDVRELDIDGDGDIGLLEAHTRARVHGRSLDIPMTTSEWWLRDATAGALETSDDAPSSLATPEEDRVIEALGAVTGRRDVAAVRQELDRLQASLGPRSEGIAARLLEADERLFALRIALLERWPVLDDPWHPEFDGTFQSQRPHIERFLAESRERREWSSATDLAAESSSAMEADELRMTLLLRLEQAYRTRSLAGRLQAEGGASWERYQMLLRCERAPL